MTNFARIALAIFAVLLLVPAAALAQDGSTTVTQDEVNEIAKRMYCPVCENIPLDTCGTAACDDWRYEIELMLMDGYTEEEIRQDFVARFGERVVGTPYDPVLRAIALVTPWLLSALAVFVALQTFVQWRRHSMAAATAAPAPVSEPSTELDDYRARIERDLYGES
jgi:cytochrome c-type biogenesis protein CcmH